MTFGHPAWEDGPPPQLCPWCGAYHDTDRCPYYTPGEEPGADDDGEWDPGPEPPYVSGSAEWPLWMLGEWSLELPAYTYRQVSDRSDN